MHVAKFANVCQLKSLVFDYRLAPEHPFPAALDDCVNVARIAKQFGVDVTLRQWDKLIHAFPLLSPLFPEATKALLEICDFINHKTISNGDKRKELGWKNR